MSDGNLDESLLSREAEIRLRLRAREDELAALQQQQQHLSSSFSSSTAHVNSAFLSPNVANITPIHRQHELRDLLVSHRSSIDRREDESPYVRPQSYSRQDAEAIAELREKLERAEAALASRERDLQIAKVQLSLRDSDVEKKSSEFSKASEELLYVKNESSELRSQLHSAQQKVTDLEKRVADQETAMSEDHRLIISRANAENALRTELEEFRQSADMHLKEASLWQQRAKTLESSMEDMGTLIKELEKTIRLKDQQLQESLGDAALERANRRSVEEAVISSHGELSSKRSELEVANRKLREIGLESEKLERNIEYITRDRDRLAAALEKAEAALRASSEELEKTRERAEEMEVRLRARTRSSEEQWDQLRGHQLALEEATQRTTRIMADLTRYQAQCEALEKKTSELSQKLRDAQAEKQAYQEQHESIAIQLKNIILELETERNKRIQIEIAKNNYQDQCLRHEAEIASKSSALEHATRELTRLEASLNQEILNTKKVREELDAAERKNERLQQLLQTTQTAIDGEKNRMATRADALSDAGALERITALETENFQLKQRHLAAERQHQQEIEEKTELCERIRKLLLASRNSERTALELATRTSVECEAVKAMLDSLNGERSWLRKRLDETSLTSTSDSNHSFEFKRLSESLSHALPYQPATSYSPSNSTASTAHQTLLNSAPNKKQSIGTTAQISSSSASAAANSSGFAPPECPPLPAPFSRNVHDDKRCGIGIGVSDEPPASVAAAEKSKQKSAFSRFWICQVLPGMAADQSSNVRIGDELIRIDGKNVRDLTLEDVSRLIPGPEGTTVVLSLKRDAQEHFVLLQRGKK